MTKEELYVLEEEKIKNGTPISINGFSTVDDIDKDKKVNMILNRGSILYNFEID